MRVERSRWAELVPHRNRMALIERVLHYDADRIGAESDNHRASDHPLRSRNRLHAVHLCEYGAQSMAVHGALVARDSGGAARPGLLVALRAVDLHVERIDNLPGPLRIDARREHADANAWLYRFEIRHAGQLLAEGRATVMLDANEDLS